MPNLSTNMGFNLFLESDVVDFEQLNANFEKLDKMVLCIESGTKTSSYSGNTTGNATWNYKKYSDGTIDLDTAIGFDTLKCNQGSKAPYYTGNCRVYFPFTITKIDNVQIHMSSETKGWVCNLTGKDVVDYILFNIMGMESESNYVFKKVFINVKGRWK